MTHCRIGERGKQCPRHELDLEKTQSHESATGGRKLQILDNMINPRLATLAEVAWSSDHRRNWSEFRSTLKHNMNLLTKLGWKHHDF